MLCCHCNKNQATKVKERYVDGKKTSSYYCAECFRTLFLIVEENAPSSPSKCPYCGKDKEAVLRSGLVGCANCYTVFHRELVPLIAKLQGEESHAGEAPYASREERLQTRYNELQVLIRKRRSEKDFDRAKEYTQESSRITALKEGK